MELINGTFVETEVMAGTVDSVNRTFSVSQNYLKLLVFYNGILYQPDNTHFGYTVNPGTNSVLLDYTPDAGDCLIAFYITKKAPSDLIKGDFPTIVAQLIESPNTSLSRLLPGLGVTNVRPNTGAGNIRPSTEAGGFKPNTFVNGG